MPDCRLPSAPPEARRAGAPAAANPARRALLALPLLMLSCGRAKSPPPAVVGLPRVLDRRRTLPDWLGEIRDPDGIIRQTLLAPYPIATLVQHGFTEGLERRGELALDAPPRLDLRIEIHRFECIAVVRLDAAADLDLVLSEAGSGRERDRQRALRNVAAPRPRGESATVAALREMSRQLLDAVVKEGLDAPRFRAGLA